MAQQRRIAESQNFKAEGKADYQLGGPRRNNFRIAGDTHGYLYSLSAILEERKEQKCGRAGLQWRRKLETWTP
jgi:hypothetical protein